MLFANGLMEATMEVEPEVEEMGSRPPWWDLDYQR
jgi:hypothetical protein